MISNHSTCNKPFLLKRVDRTATKPYHCEANCGGIKTGDRYVAYFYTIRFRIITLRFCETCDKALFGEQVA